MRAYEILENRNPPSQPITLRALHKLKHEGRAKEESENLRLELLPKMYANPARRREELELERLELELAQMRAEIAATEAEIGLKSREAVSDMARSGIAGRNRWIKGSLIWRGMGCWVVVKSAPPSPENSDKDFLPRHFNSAVGRNNVAHVGPRYQNIP